MFLAGGQPAHSPTLDLYPDLRIESHEALGPTFHFAAERFGADRFELP
jgi:hypothetical protein